MKKSTKLAIVSLLVSGALLAGCNVNSNQSTRENVKETKKTEVTTDNSKSVTENIKYYFTANEGGSITKIDASSNEVAETFPVDGAVHNVQVSPDGKILGATVVPSMNHGGEDTHSEGADGEDTHGSASMEMKGKAIFFDTETNELVQTIEVGNHPAHIVFTEDGKYALVSNNEDNNVTVIEVKSFTVTETIGTGMGPHGFRISDDSKKAYIANMNEDSVSVLNLETMTEEKKIKVGAAPVTTALTSDGKMLVTTLNAENMLAIVDLATDKVEKVEVGVGPAQVYIDESNQFAYVANQGTETAPSNTVSVVDLVAKKVTATIETGKGSHGVISDGDRLYVTNMYENTVTVIETKQNTVIETFEVGETPNGISIMN